MIGFWVVRGDRCLMLNLGDLLWVMKERSLFDVGNRRSGFVGEEGAIDV
ncbi:hypothetical protein [Pseudanabaena yagii]|uniref:Uncharacterized protein n=1 Tax=Pseudanabaena yagii GIHE-NHR1 TaxID=2722753 RepID=A0ABX1LW01_9CYAN|nr:hypothetical protein [Pseudanabaena yagii]NMF60363.1 hypothetical protein [Pseudanabaena yagii GIHE-NHR1]